jgi:CheY-like chemotaxis protein
LYAFQPDLLFLEWDLPGLEGKDRIETIRQLNPELNVVVICSQGSLGEVKGADSIVSTGDPPERVLSVLHAFNGSRD